MYALVEYNRNWETGPVKTCRRSPTKVLASCHKRRSAMKAAREGIGADHALLRRDLANVNFRRDEFIAELFHELRNSLCPIRFAVAMLRREASARPVVAKAETLTERSVTQMSRLVEDLLDTSRISNGRLRLQRERVHLRVIVNNAIEGLEADLNERKHRLAIEMPDVQVWLKADPG